LECLPWAFVDQITRARRNTSDSEEISCAAWLRFPWQPLTITAVPEEQSRIKEHKFRNGPHLTPGAKHDCDSTSLLLKIDLT
jgi:hypothetical protein